VVDFRWYHYSRYRYSMVFYPLMFDFSSTHTN